MEAAGEGGFELAAVRTAGREGKGTVHVAPRQASATSSLLLQHHTSIMIVCWCVEVWDTAKLYQHFQSLMFPRVASCRTWLFTWTCDDGCSESVILTHRLSMPRLLVSPFYHSVISLCVWRIYLNTFFSGAELFLNSQSSSVVCEHFHYSCTGCDWIVIMENPSRIILRNYYLKFSPSPLFYEILCFDQTFCRFSRSSVTAIFCLPDVTDLTRL